MYYDSNFYPLDSRPPISNVPYKDSPEFTEFNKRIERSHFWRVNYGFKFDPHDYSSALMDIIGYNMLQKSENLVPKLKEPSKFSTNDTSEYVPRKNSIDYSLVCILVGVFIGIVACVMIGIRSKDKPI
jgi:hypothetical protein